MPLTRVRGSVWDSTDNIVVNVIENLYDPNISTEGIIFVSGSMSVNDGGGGWYKWEAEEPKANHDGYSIIDPSKGTSSGNGCWIRQNFISTSLGSNKSEVQIATLGQTVFKIHNFVYEPGNGELAIYVNGLRLIPSDYIETDPQTVTLKAPLRAGDEVEIIAQEQPQSGQDVCTPAAEICYDNTNSDLQSKNVQDALDELAAREGQPGTSRTEALWINSEGVKAFAWVNNPSALDVFLNGVHLDPQEDYNSDGTTLTLTVALQSADDRLLAQSYAAAEDYFPTFYNRVSFTNSAGVDTFPWVHSPANVNIFLNGSRLVNVMDYTATGNEIILAKALISNNDVLEGFSFTTFNVADAISPGQYDAEQAIQDGRLDSLEDHADIPDSPIDKARHLPTGGTDGQILTKDGATEGASKWATATGLERKGEGIPGSGGDVWTVVNGYTFTGSFAVGGVIPVTANTLLQVSYDGEVYDYYGPTDVDIGSGGYTTTVDDWAATGSSDHAVLTGRTDADAHSTASITGLDVALDARLGKTEFVNFGFFKAMRLLATGNGVSDPTVSADYNVASVSRTSTGTYRITLTQDTFWGVQCNEGNSMLIPAVKLPSTANAQVQYLYYVSPGVYDLFVYELSPTGPQGSFIPVPYDLVVGDTMEVLGWMDAGDGTLPPVAAP